MGKREQRDWGNGVWVVVRLKCMWPQQGCNRGPQVEWTPRCPDSKEGHVSQKWLKCRLIFHLTWWRDGRIPCGDFRESHSPPALQDRGPHILSLTSQTLIYSPCFPYFSWSLLHNLSLPPRSPHSFSFIYPKMVYKPKFYLHSSMGTRIFMCPAHVNKLLFFSC